MNARRILDGASTEKGADEHARLVAIPFQPLPSDLSAGHRPAARWRDCQADRPGGQGLAGFRSRGPGLTCRLPQAEYSGHRAGQGVAGNDSATLARPACLIGGLAGVLWRDQGRRDAGPRRSVTWPRRNSWRRRGATPQASERSPGQPVSRHEDERPVAAGHVNEPPRAGKERLASRGEQRAGSRMPGGGMSRLRASSSRH